MTHDSGTCITNFLFTFLICLYNIPIIQWNTQKFLSILWHSFGIRAIFLMRPIISLCSLLCLSFLLTYLLIFQTTMPEINNIESSITKTTNLPITTYSTSLVGDVIIINTTTHLPLKHTLTNFSSMENPIWNLDVGLWPRWISRWMIPMFTKNHHRWRKNLYQFK